MTLLIIIIGIIYLFSFCLLRCASLADREYEILARKKFFEESLTSCADANTNSEGCAE